MPSEIKVLGRVAVCHDWGWSLETDPGLLEMAVEKLELAEAKGVATPGVRPDGGCSGADVKSRRLYPMELSNPDSESGPDTMHPLFWNLTC